MTMKLQLSIFGFLSCVISMAHSESIQFEDCSALGYKVKSVDISPCPVSPCEFPSGSNVTVKAIYEVDKDWICHESLKTEIVIYPGGIDILSEPLEGLGLGSVGNLAGNLISGIAGGNFKPDGLVPIPFPIPDSNSCHFLTPPCPICDGETTEFNQTFEIYSTFPKMFATVKVLKVDETGKTIFCFKFLATLV